MNTRIGSSALALTRLLLAGVVLLFLFLNVAIVASGQQPPPRVQVIPCDQEAAEWGGDGNPDPADFGFWRNGDTAAALTVYFTISGTAGNGADYQALPASVTFPAGADHTAVVVTPIADGEEEDFESVVLTLSPDAAYAVGPLSNATVWISGEEPTPLPDPWRVRVYATDDRASESETNSGRFIITRSDDWYDTSRPLTVDYTLNGIASNGVDYATLAGSVTIPAGATYTTVNLSPISDSIPEGTESVTLSLSRSFDYFVRSPDNATVTIEDNDSLPSPFPALTHETKLNAQGPVAISGDTIVIGSNVFVRGPDGWAGQQTLSAGLTAAIDGDTLVIGANVYVRAGTNWSLQQTLPVGGSFTVHSSVAISGDTIAVGLTSDGTRGQYAGAVFVFVRNGTTWSQQAKLTASDGATDAGLGYSVSLWGDTLVAGAPGVNFTFSGKIPAAYVFVRNGTNWSEQAKLTGDPEETYSASILGLSVSISGDTVVAGDPYDDGGGQDAGAAFVFLRNGTAWALQQKLTGIRGDFFGWDVAVKGDVLLGGAPMDSERGSSSGAAYLFGRNGTNWIQLQKLTASDAAASDNFGERVALGSNTVLLSAYGDISRPGSDVGAACVYESESVVAPGGKPPVITSISKTPAVGIEITWSSVPGKDYRVAFKNSLTDTNWTDLDPAVVATGTSATFTDTTAGPNKQRYYVVYAPN